jgi:hypothetical protein
VRALRSCQVHNQRPSQRFPEFWHRTHYRFGWRWWQQT